MTAFLPLVAIPSMSRAMVLIGEFLIFPNWISLIYLIAATDLIHRQVLREEEYLKGHYGEAYEQYCRCRACLGPKHIIVAIALPGASYHQVLSDLYRYRWPGNGLVANVRFDLSPACFTAGRWGRH
jgi:hypothetical protein